MDKTGPIDPWIPLMLFTILFGLSMDYEVFLLSRIREEWLRTGDNATAVADGLAKTARVITAAAAIMFCVFGSFVIGDVRVLKVFGLGLAVAVLDRRHHRAPRPRARHHGAARQGQLVVPQVARPHRPHPRRRRRDRTGAARAGAATGVGRQVAPLEGLVHTMIGRTLAQAIERVESQPATQESGGRSLE